jgi:hypothetical protein
LFERQGCLSDLEGNEDRIDSDIEQDAGFEASCSFVIRLVYNVDKKRKPTPETEQQSTLSSNSPSSKGLC